MRTERLAAGEPVCDWNLGPEKVDSKLRKRREKTKQLAESATDKSFEALVTASKDPDQDVRYWAVQGLSRLGSTSEGVLLDILTSDPDVHGRTQAAIALTRIKSSKAIDPIMPLLRNKCWAASDQVAESLRVMGPASLPALISMLKDSDDDARELAAEALGFIGNPRAILPLIESLSDSNGFVRTAAATSLGRFGEPAAAPLLAAAQDVSDPNRSGAARWALRFLEGSPARDPIVDLANFREPDEVRNRLRNHYRQSESSPAYFNIVKICGPSYCLQRYQLPDIPFFFPRMPNEPDDTPVNITIFPNGRTLESYSDGTRTASVVRRFAATLNIEADGSVSSVRFDIPAFDDPFFGLLPALRTWKFGDFVAGLSYPIQHRIVVEFTSDDSRPRYPYGRPWVELGLDALRIASHPGLPHIN